MKEEIKERLSKTNIASDYSEQLKKSNRKGDSPLDGFYRVSERLSVHGERIRNARN